MKPAVTVGTKPEKKAVISPPEYKDFKKAVLDERDPTMVILRAHLYTESLLERMILGYLPRPDKVFDHASLTYAQKLALVESFDVLNDSVTSVLRNLNRLRNQCAHELGKTIGESDIVKLGSPLGKNFTRMKRENAGKKNTLLQVVLGYVCGYVTASCHGMEGSFVKKEVEKGKDKSETEKDNAN